MLVSGVVGGGMGYDLISKGRYYLMFFDIFLFLFLKFLTVLSSPPTIISTDT